MHDGIIRIALERLVRVVKLHPPVKRIVEKQIRQDRTDPSTLSKASYYAKYWRVTIDLRSM